ncbi:MAG TPA: 1-(5-phosphoribosyl)-5-[(5-phosphoribosylamino)methylideneamino]imidazole-4-carboxamide isomerase [Armatimonadota bacterium]
MELIPAIDLRGGKCVRLLQGRFDAETVYGDDPVAMALRFQEQGATRIHVVDLEGAKEGHPVQTEVMRAIASAVRAPVQTGGGLRTLEAIRSVLDAGAQRAVLGTIAITDPALAQQAFQEFGDAVILGLDARGGQVATHGWVETTPLSAVDVAKRMQDAGARRIIFTDIGRDGMLEGVNVEALREMAQSVAIPVIASGGVSTLADLEALKPLEPLGIEGVITGKALYAGTITIPDALKVLAGGR